MIRSFVLAKGLRKRQPAVAVEVYVKKLPLGERKSFDAEGVVFPVVSEIRFGYPEARPT